MLKRKRAKLFPDPILIDLSEAVQDQIRIAVGFDSYRKRFVRFLEIESATGNFDDLTKGFVSG